MLVDIGNGALLEGDPIGALQSLNQAETQDHQLPELHHSKALAYYARKDLASAVQSAKKAIEIKPNYSDANNTLGKLLLDLGKDQEAMAPLTLAANDPTYRESYKAWTNLGILKFNRGEYVQSEFYFSRAILDSPLQACIAYYYRGQIKTKELKLNDAIQDYTQATKKLCARFGDARLALGTALQKNRQYDDARKTFLEIQKLYPNTKLAEQALDYLKYLP